MSRIIYIKLNHLQCCHNYKHLQDCRLSDCNPTVLSYKQVLNAYIDLSERKIHVCALCFGKRDTKEFKKDYIDLTTTALN